MYPNKLIVIQKVQITIFYQSVLSIIEPFK